MRNLFLSLVLFSGLANAQEEYYLEGKINKASIFMTIDVYGSDADNVQATYFYKSSLKDIQLEGNQNKTSFNLVFKDYSTNVEKPFEKFELTKSKDNSFKGFWINKNGKKFPVSLKPINFSKYAKASIEIQNKMDAVKLSLLEFKQDSVSVYKGKQFTWFSEKHCESPFFRLGGNFPDKNKSVVNPVLQKIHLENTLNQLDCSSRYSYSEGKNIEYTIGIHYLNANLLGFQVFSSWDCGGAHPDFGGKGYLFDLNNGKEYQLDQIIAFDKSVTTEAQSSFELYAAYRTNFFAPKLYALIDQNEHFQKPKDDAEDCDYTDLEIWDFPSWNFTEKGIEFTPIFARYMRACETSFLVTFKQLEPYRNSSFPYELR